MLVTMVFKGGLPSMSGQADKQFEAAGAEYAGPSADYARILFI